MIDQSGYVLIYVIFFIGLGLVIYLGSRNSKEAKLIAKFLSDRGIATSKYMAEYRLLVAAGIPVYLHPLPLVLGLVVPGVGWPAAAILAYFYWAWSRWYVLRALGHTLSELPRALRPGGLVGFLS